MKVFFVRVRNSLLQSWHHNILDINPSVFV